MAFGRDIFDFYQVTKGNLERHILKIQDIIDPYFQVYNFKLRKWYNFVVHFLWPASTSLVDNWAGS